jgi:hypothetical protein
MYTMVMTVAIHGANPVTNIPDGKIQSPISTETKSVSQAMHSTLLAQSSVT